MFYLMQVLMMFLFLCILHSKGKSYIMHCPWGALLYYLEHSHLCFLFCSISCFMCLEVLSFIFGILCHHEKCGEFGLFVGTLLFLGVGFVSFLVSCVDLLE